MADLKIKVGASVDRNLAVAYQPLVEAANKAAAAVAAAGVKGGRATAAATKQGTSAAEKEYAKLARSAELWQRQAVRAAERASRDEVKSAERATRDKIREAEKVTRARQRENDKIVRDAERAEHRATAAAQHAAAAKSRMHERAGLAAQRQNSRQGWQLAASLASGAFGLGKRALGAGIGLAKSAVSGMGVDLDYESLVSKGVDLEKRSVDLVNSGYMPGHGGMNGQRQDAAGVRAQISDVSIRTANDAGDTMQGLQAFVAKTGDLETGRAVLFDLAKLSKATGANMGDMADAAGDVANQLGDVPDKGKAIASVMGAIAAQGKEGAVEIKDLASQMAKLGAAAGQFSGDRAQSIANMGALVQMTRAKGGAASSTQAASAVGTFTATFSKGKRVKELDAFGVDYLGADGKVDAKKAIIGAIAAADSAAKGNQKEMGLNMGRMFMDVNARRVTRGFESVFHEAGGGKAGLEAASKAFDDLARTVMNNEEVENSFALAMQTSDAKAKIFNEQLAAIADESRSNLLPALQSLAPTILGWSKSLADWIGKVTGKTRDDQSAASYKAQIAGEGAITSLNADLANGKLLPGDTEQAAKAKTALESAVAGQKAKISADRDALTAGSDALPRFKGANKLSALHQLDNMSDEEFQHSDLANNKEAQNYRRDQEQLANMERTLNDLNQTLQDAMQRALEGSIVTVRLSDPIVIATPSLSAPTAGVEPAPGMQVMPDGSLRGGHK